MTQAAQLRPLGAMLETEVLGIDLSKPLDGETFAWIQRTFAEHSVLVFRGQDLDAPTLAALLGLPYRVEADQRVLTEALRAAPAGGDK